jgi:tetratricopeptide (TPR) repeat protein
MANNTSHNKVWWLVCIAVLSLFHLLAKNTDKMEFDHLYKMAQFSRIAAILKNFPFDTLSSQDKFLYIECLAKSAQRNEAEKLMQKPMAEDVFPDQAHLTAAIVHTSRGQFVEAEHNLKQALRLNPESPKTKIAMMMLALYLQKYREVLDMHEEFMKGDPEWTKSYLSHLLGIEIYGTVGDIAKIAELYETQANKFKKLDKKQHQNFQKNFRLYRKQSKNKAFQSKTTSSRVALPFVELTNKDSFATISLEIKDKRYKVLLDTGNRVGWTIHSRELEKRLKHRPGGTVLTQIGAEEGMIHGHLLLTKQLDFPDITLQHLTGMYVPKPHPNYPEANLNPLFIRDRVVTLDFKNKELILRTKERFHEDIMQVSSQSEKVVTLPWYGYEQAFIPVVVNNRHKALAMIETGAQEITVNLDFALWHRLPLEPAIKYLSTGKEFSYHKIPLQMSIGHFRMQRRATDVWSLERLADPLTGLIPDILLGPDLFKERYVVTFNPYEKTIIITEFSF